MSQVYALIFGIPALLFAYIAFKLDDRHAVMRMFLVSWAWISVLPLPIAGAELAKQAGLTGIRKLMDIFLIPMIFGFIFWVFYLIILYLKDSMTTAQNPGDEFDNEM